MTSQTSKSTIRERDFARSERCLDALPGVAVVFSADEADDGARTMTCEELVHEMRAEGAGGAREDLERR
jgi:hypothetical protein